MTEELTARNPETPNRDRRRFTIIDAMVLIAATAIGMAWMRLIGPDRLRPEPGNYAGWLVAGPSTCLAAPMALGLIVLRLRRPRPRRRRLVIQPGFVACAATPVSLLLGLGGFLFFLMVHTDAPGQAVVYRTSIYWAWAVGATRGFVLGAWLGLWLAGRWAPEPSWIDRAGRVLGLFWIAGLAWEHAGPIVEHFVPVL